MPNICYQPPMRSEGNVVGLIAVGSCLALDQPDDLIVGCAGSTGEVEAISIPSTSPLPPIARLKPPGVASVVPVTPSTAICSGLPVPRGPAHPLSHGHQVTRDDLRRIGPGGGRAGG